MTLKELFNAVLEGETLQTKTQFGEWQDTFNMKNALCILATRGDNPEEMLKIRIKPEPPPDVVKYGGVYQQVGTKLTAIRGAWDASIHVLTNEIIAGQAWPLKAKIKVVFDGESGEVKSVEKVN